MTMPICRHVAEDLEFGISDADIEELVGPQAAVLNEIKELDRSRTYTPKKRQLALEGIIMRLNTFVFACCVNSLTLIEPELVRRLQKAVKDAEAPKKDLKLAFKKAFVSTSVVIKVEQRAGGCDLGHTSIQLPRGLDSTARHDDVACTDSSVMSSNDFLQVMKAGKNLHVELNHGQDKVSFKKHPPRHKTRREDNAPSAAVGSVEEITHSAVSDVDVIMRLKTQIRRDQPLRVITPQIKSETPQVDLSQFERASEDQETQDQYLRNRVSGDARIRFRSGTFLRVSEEPGRLYVTHGGKSSEELQNFKRHEGKIRDYLKKLFDIMDQLQDMEVEIHEDLLAVIQLYSLPANFRNFRCAIVSCDELPDPETLRIKTIKQCDMKGSNSDKVYILDANAANS
ncbi:hypothetical protein ANTQUA_LOCUS822 [Anthophora quadrimaculata]